MTIHLHALGGSVEGHLPQLGGRQRQLTALLFFFVVEVAKHQAVARQSDLRAGARLPVVLVLLQQLLGCVIAQLRGELIEQHPDATRQRGGDECASWHLPGRSAPQAPLATRSLSALAPSASVITTARDDLKGDEQTDNEQRQVSGTGLHGPEGTVDYVSAHRRPARWTACRLDGLHVGPPSASRRHRGLGA